MSLRRGLLQGLAGLLLASGLALAVKPISLPSLSISATSLLVLAGLLVGVVFVRRQLRFLVAALLFIGCSLVAGTLGYMHFAGERAVDAFLDASMILSGMGPVGALPNDAAKVFAACYALYSGVALLTTVAVILAGLFPILIGHGAGSEVMSRIAAPMIGGMLTAPLLSMFVVPAGYLLLRRRRSASSAAILKGDQP